MNDQHSEALCAASFYTLTDFSCKVSNSKQICVSGDYSVTRIEVSNLKNSYRHSLHGQVLEY